MVGKVLGGVKSFARPTERPVPPAVQALLAGWAGSGKIVAGDGIYDVRL